MSNFDALQSSTQSQLQIKDSLSLPPPAKIYSLMPDLLTGWKPKNIKIPGPIIIKYKQRLISAMLQFYKNSPQKIIYRGPRYSNSIKFHEQIQHQYNLKYGLTSDDIPTYLKNQLKQQQPPTTLQQISFKGMNPLLPSDYNLIFDSQFQSGNLDLVIKSEDGYDLFLRPDTNTSGHMQWFYFRIKNTSKCKIKLSICNNKKSSTLFSRGMKPYTSSLRNNQPWSQQRCTNIQYQKYQILQQIIQKQTDLNNNIKNNNTSTPTSTTNNPKIIQNYYKLSFQYQFLCQNDQVYFAYCPPYTYSQLKTYIKLLMRSNNYYNNNQQKNHQIIVENTFGMSLSGLDIPILTITDQSVNNQEKMCIVAIGRLHPGQSNGSYAIQGFINYLLSEQARQMRRHVIFKIVPMINPDGVVFGNYRTSLSGKDLNRQFKTKSLQLIPQIVELKQLMKKIKYQNKYKIMYFLDFHGHSLKKNVFFYGPQYDIWSAKYQKAKILAKILSSKTDMFRMKSCLYKVANFKQTTARAYMLAYIPYCYTIQSSVGIYKNKKNIDILLTIKDWLEIGSKIGQSFSQIIEKQIQNNIKLSKRKQKKQNKSILIPTQFIKQDDLKSTTKQTPISTVRSAKYLNPIKNLKKRPIKNIIDNTTKNQIEKIDEQQCQSDKFSQGNSDCQSDDNDLPKNQYDLLKQKIVNVMQNFQLLMIGNKNHIFIDNKKVKKIIKIKKSKDSTSNNTTHKKVEQMLLVPSLKHKLTKLILSQKKIGFLNSLSRQRPMIHQYKGRGVHRNTMLIHH